MVMMEVLRVSPNNPTAISSYLFAAPPSGVIYIYSQNFWRMMSLDGFRQKIAKRIGFSREVFFNIILAFFSAYFWHQPSVDDVKLRLVCVSVPEEG